MRTLLITLLALLAPLPVVAQEWLVARQNFGFIGNRLTIHVDAEAPGTLRLVRGTPGSVSVASRTEYGFTTAGLADDDELTLTAAGPGEVDYLVAVPQDVWVQVRLPGARFGESVPSRTRSRAFEWSAIERAAAQAADAWLPPLHEPASLFTTFTRDVSPTVVQLPDLAYVRSLTVRLEEGRFRIMTSRPLTVRQGAEDRLEIRPGAPPMNIVITLPSTAPLFRLEVAGSTALLVERGAVTALCSPVTDQRLSNERRWLTFNPVDGALECTGHSAPRHEG